MVSNVTPTPQQRADQNRQKAIGRELKRLYAEIAAEPSPESFLILLEKADQRLTK